MVAQARKVGETATGYPTAAASRISRSATSTSTRPGLTITEADDTWLPLLTMNQHPLHFDREYARHTESDSRP